MMHFLVPGFLAVLPLVSTRASEPDCVRNPSPIDQGSVSSTAQPGHWVWWWNGYHWVFLFIPRLDL
jgi:hypothetical protein